ncbi:DinB family protein [Paenibacillus cellulositrophicus]|uniref:Damage-inducible protein DinB n=1 Tax=Paenibacillus favisporus TaxID=221028 RepID=A0ABV2F2M2_9BACL|nr:MULTISPECIES: DinB family protein [Paenibacillus]MCM2997279.1 DinB family protein [Paenibacillus cellulositrophicus]RED41538.1 putative damage-inducible protein DinB [Paenibacillus sp. VMFN-D1]
MNDMPEKLAPMCELIDEVKALADIPEDQWTGAIAEGKWSPQEIIGHIMLWDKHFLEHAIRPMAAKEPMDMPKVELDEFNREAAAYARSQGRQELIDQTVHWREQIIGELKRIPEEEYATEYSTGSGKLSVDEYLADFYWHDRHHMNQIHHYIANGHK